MIKKKQLLLFFLGTSNFQEGIFQDQKENLFSKNQEFILGASLPKKFSLEKVGSAIENGFNLAFSKCNQSGGLGGKIKITFDVKNDQNDREMTKKNIHELLKQTALCTGCLGTDSIDVLTPMLQKNELFLLFPFDGAFPGREKFRKNMVFLRASIEKEIRALLSYALQQGIKTVSIFYEDSSFGVNGLKIAEKIVKEMEEKNTPSKSAKNEKLEKRSDKVTNKKDEDTDAEKENTKSLQEKEDKGGSETTKQQEETIRILVKTSYPKNTVNIMKAVKDITQNQQNKPLPQAILCISQIYPTYNFIEQLVNAGLTNCLFLGVGELFEIQSVISKDRGKMVLSSVMPNPEKSELEIVQEYRAEMKKQRPLDDLSPLSLEGFVCGKLIINLLEKIFPEPNLEKLRSQLEKMNENFMGLELKKTPGVDSLLNSVWINEFGLSKDWVEIK